MSKKSTGTTPKATTASSASMLSVTYSAARSVSVDETKGNTASVTCWSASASYWIR